MNKGTVKIKETLHLESSLVKFEAEWPSGKTFTKYVDLGDDVNERRRQERFATEREYEVEWDEEGIIYGE
jgi:hypothetical protein